MQERSGTVYSTDKGRCCPACGRPVNACTCSSGEVARGNGRVCIRLEIKGRQGKAVTVITGLPLAPGGLRDLARQLKRVYGTGGTVKDLAIELQGDYREQVRILIGQLGYLVV